MRQNNQNIRYEGEVAGYTIDNGAQHKIDSGTANFDINFGSNSPVSGSVEFTSNAQKWAVDISGGIETPNGVFLDKAVSSGATSDVAVQSSKMSLLFYGTAAEVAGGNFALGSAKSLEDSEQQAIGVFQTQQQ
jgi:hypothetical protein